MTPNATFFSDLPISTLENKAINIYQKVIEVNSKSTENILYTDTFFKHENKDLFFNNDTSSFIVFSLKEKGEGIFSFLPYVAFNHLLTEKWLKINKIKYDIISLQEIGNIEILLDYIFDTFDDLLLNNKYDICNSFFEFIDVKELDINSMVGILTITSPWKGLLSLREVFFKEVKDFVYLNFPSEEAKKILIGFE